MQGVPLIPLVVVLVINLPKCKSRSISMNRVSLEFRARNSYDSAHADGCAWRMDEACGKETQKTKKGGFSKKKPFRIAFSCMDSNSMRPSPLWRRLLLIDYLPLLLVTSEAPAHRDLVSYAFS